MDLGPEGSMDWVHEGFHEPGSTGFHVLPRSMSGSMDLGPEECMDWVHERFHEPGSRGVHGLGP